MIWWGCLVLSWGWRGRVSLAEGFTDLLTPSSLQSWGAPGATDGSWNTRKKDITAALLVWLSPAASWKFPKGFAQLRYFSRKLSWVEGTLLHHHPGFRVSASSPRDSNGFVTIMFESVCVAQGMAGAALQHKVQCLVLGRSQHNCWESN